MKGQTTRLSPVIGTAGGGSLSRALTGQVFGVGRVPRVTRLWAMACVVASVTVIGLAGAPSVATGVRAPVSPAPEMGLRTLSLAAQGPVASALGRADRAYWVHGSSARNPAQHLHLGFSAAGPTVASGHGLLRLSLSAFGRPGALRAVAPVTPSASANRVVYAHPGLREWYANGPLGLEQGFDVARAPSGGAGRLTLALSLAGDLRARASGAGLIFSGQGTSLRYTGLTATDARGRRLPASIALRGGRLVLSVDDRGAAYPLRIDPFVQVGELTEPTTAAFDSLGYSVAVSGTTIVVGAPAHMMGTSASQGAVFVFSEAASGWANATPTAMLTASDGAAGDSLGYTVAISGTTIVSGAPGHAVSGHAGHGAAYVFVEPKSGGWKNATQTAELTASDNDASDTGGYFPVAISGNTIVFGGYEQTVGANMQQGAVYVFVEPPTGWPKTATQTAELTASDGAAQDIFGLEVGVSGNTIAAISHKALYVFTGSGSSWSQKAELTTASGPIVPDGSDQLSMTNNTIAMGGVYVQVGANSDQGAVWVFQEPPTGWASGIQPAELTSSDGNAGSDLGFSVSISGNTIVSGAPGQTVGAASYSQGVVDVFQAPPNGVWVSGPQTAELTDSPGGVGDGLGYSAGISGTTVVGGTHGHQKGAFVFSSHPGPIGPTAAPANTARPKISGTAKSGKKLACSKGSWTNTPTSFAYQWNRDGTPIPGAAKTPYAVQKLDEGLTLTCSVTASNAIGPSSPATSNGVKVAVPNVHLCPAATGKLDGQTLGLVKLGMTRQQARRKYKHSSNRGKKYEDFFCLTPIGVRVAYGSPKLPKKERKKFENRVIWASTSSAFYALRGVRASATVKAAGTKLKLTGPFHIGLNTWYLAPNGSSTGVLKTRHGIVEEIGIGEKVLTANHKAQVIFLHSFS
jgi:FG-GAP repeat